MMAQRCVGHSGGRFHNTILFLVFFLFFFYFFFFF